MRKELAARAGYMNRAWDPVNVGKEMKETMAGVDYDTLVGTGLSGAIIVPYLARKLRKRAVIVRKRNDSSHSWKPLEGVLGRRWVFVDDFIDTGATKIRVTDTIGEFVAKHNRSHKREPFTTEYVGDFLYNNGVFTSAEEYAEEELAWQQENDAREARITANALKAQQQMQSESVLFGADQLIVFDEPSDTLTPIN